MKCKFLIGWMDGCDSNDGEETGIFETDDLLKLYKEKSEHVTCFEYFASKGKEWDTGAAIAFQANFTAYDTLSTVLDENDNEIA